VTTPPARDRLGQAFELYRRTPTSRTAIALLVANAIPLVGVLFFGWSLWTVLVLYWLENGIVGLWTIPRILLARGELAVPVAPRGAATVVMPLISAAARPVMAAFFLVHYGVFWIGHGFFVLFLPTMFGLRSATLDGGLPTLDPATGLPTFDPAPAAAGGGFGEIVWSSVALGAVALFLSHGLTFVLDYLGKREYLRTSAPAEAMKPYGRVVVLHLTILAGAFAILVIGAPILLIAILVALKAALDLRLHLRHKVAAGTVGALTGGPG
jgi:uncharacterized protein DUF6498